MLYLLRPGCENEVLSNKSASGLKIMYFPLAVCMDVVSKEIYIYIYI